MESGYNKHFDCLQAESIITLSHSPVCVLWTRSCEKHLRYSGRDFIDTIKQNVYVSDAIRCIAVV